MSSTVEAFEATMQEQYANLRGVNGTFDSARCVLLIAAMTASLAHLRGCAVIDATSPEYFRSVEETHASFDALLKERHYAWLAGQKAGKAALSRVRQLNIELVQKSEIDAVLRHACCKAALATFENLRFEDIRPSITTIGTVDALDMGIRTGIEFEAPFDGSVAVFKAALAPTIAVCRFQATLISQHSHYMCRNLFENRVNSEMEAAIEAGILIGLTELSPSHYI
ncbi:hypothetical protein GGR57DRAFT_384652 [Xylariaceae sp. FL1272]|nr:hypothetical protein GGR57DRAFT_384652 [Xylariaceae sp. FL1272]